MNERIDIHFIKNKHLYKNFKINNNGPGGIWTPDLGIRSPTSYSRL